MSESVKEKRRFFRHPIHVPIRLRVAETDAYHPSHSADISLGGLNFSWTKKLSRGTLLDITIPVREKLFDIRARVVYSKEDRRSAHFRTGVTFVDYPSAFKARLAEEVLQILEYRKSMSRELGHDITEEEAAKKWVSEFADRFQRLN